MSTVQQFYANATNFQEELLLLRSFVQDAGLKEELKWKQPCYTLDGKNVLIVSKMKDYCFIAFFKGTLMKDEAGVMVSPGENSRHAKQLRYTNVDEIEKQGELIQAYIQEAIELEKSGAKVIAPPSEDYVWPEELEEFAAQDADFKQAFERLTLGRQRAYILFFNAAKQSKTKLARIEKYQQRILDGYGMNDCVCGLSKKMPGCDGSHKALK